MNVIIYGLDKFPNLINSLSDSLKIKTFFCEDVNKKLIDGCKNYSYNFHCTENDKFIPNAPKNIIEELKTDQFLFFLIMNSRHSKAILRNSLFSFRSIDHDINSFYNLVDFFYHTLTQNKIELVIFHNIPHEGGDYLLYKVAKLLNIRTIIHYQSMMYNRYCILENIDDFKKNYPPQRIVNKEDNKYQKDTEKKLDHVNKLVFIEEAEKVLDKKSKIQKFNKNWLKLLLALFSFKKQTIYKRLIRISLYLRKLREISNYINLRNKVVSYDFDLEEKFTYFALHVTPELSVIPLGGDVFYDQITALQKLSDLLPDDFYIYVKDHPFQDNIGRDSDFFVRLKKIKNLKLIPTNFSSSELVKKSQFVSTICGTVGFEAIKIGKEVLTFGFAWYSGFSGVFQYKENFNIAELLANNIDQDIFNKELSDISKRLYVGIVDRDYEKKVSNDYCPEQNQKLLYSNLMSIINEKQ
jgi:hypothetical protein